MSNTYIDTRTEEEYAQDRAKYWGKCADYVSNLIENDPSLTAVRGHYLCYQDNESYPHWWAVDEQGKIIDPTAKQFRSNGHGYYEEFSGTVECSQCGKEMVLADHDDPLAETEQIIGGNGNYIFCGDICYGKFVGVLDDDGNPYL